MFDSTANKRVWSAAHRDRALAYRRARYAQDYAKERGRLSTRLRNWKALQTFRGAPATPEAVEYARRLLTDPCTYCGKCPALGIDHISPVSQGGQTVPENLTACCRPCNSRKGTLSLLIFLAGRTHLRRIPKKRPSQARPMSEWKQQVFAVGERNGSARLTAAKVGEIRALHAAGRTFEDIAREFGIAYNTAWAIVRRVTWRHVA